MSFKRKETVKSVPTHLRWIVLNPDQVGKEFPIVTVMTNKEWRTITLFGQVFKFNIKYDSPEEFEENYKELIKSFKRGYVIANIKDESDLENKEYTCSIHIEAKPESQGGRKYEVNNGIYKIAAPPLKESETF